MHLIFTSLKEYAPYLFLAFASVFDLPMMDD